MTVFSGERKARNLQNGQDHPPDSETEELIMDSFGYSRCEQCDEEYVFRDGSKCARCLGVSSLPVNDEDNEEGSSRVSHDLRAAAK